MKKISSRDFQKRFGQIAGKLQAGEIVEVTKRGEVIGQFQRVSRKPVKMPDFLAEVEKHTYPVEVGDRLLREFNESLS